MKLEREISVEKAKSVLLAASESEDALLFQINDLYVQELSSENKVLNEALSELHNSGEIDFVTIVRSVDKCSSSYDFHIVLRVFEKTLPLLDASVEDVLHCLAHLSQHAGRISGAFERFCSIKARRSNDSIEFILKQSELSAYALFISASILAFDLERMAEAIQAIERLITNENVTVRSQAYSSLGRIKVDEDEAIVIWELLSRSAISEHDSGCCASILRATLYFGITFPSYWSRIKELLLTFVEGAPLEVLYEISDLIAFQGNDFPENILHLLTKQLANVPPDHKGIIDNIDYLLVNLVERHSSSVALELLESILASGVNFKLLNSLSNKLLSTYREFLNYIITKWFLSGDSLLCQGIADLLHTPVGKNIEIKADTQLLRDEEEQLFASFKAVGWLFTRPIAAASFILSIYETASETARKELETILYDPLLLSYPGDLQQFFQSCIDNNFQAHACNHLLSRLRDYYADIEKTSGLKELIAPSENVRAYWKEVNKSIEEAHDEASKSSIIQLIATTKRLLYGNSSIYYMHQLSGKQIRQEMKMQHISHSTEMPMLGVLDPENLDYTLRIYRYGVMKNEVDS